MFVDIKSFSVQDPNVNCTQRGVGFARVVEILKVEGKDLLSIVDCVLHMFGFQATASQFSKTKGGQD